MEFNYVSDGACEVPSPGGHADVDWLMGGAGVGEFDPGSLIPDFAAKPYEVYCGDAVETIRKLGAGGVRFDCVVTSPPYYRKRRYGKSEQEIGQEKDVNSFVSSLVRVFREIPLRPWGSIWVNLGDKRGPNKELLEVPERFAVAMQNAGFFLVDKVVWAKEVVMVDGTSLGRCMVEPANGRLNENGWEPFYRFVRDPDKAWSDTCAVRIPRDSRHFFQEGTETPVAQHPYKLDMECVTSLEGKNASAVWYVGKSRKGRNFFAAYPSCLVERPIAMTCPEYLVDDGGEIKPRERIVEPTVYSEGPGKSKRMIGQYTSTVENLQEKSGRMDSGRQYIPQYPRTLGWTHEDRSVVGPGIVLDPFGGTGTTGEVAILLGRRFVGIDLYQDNADRMKERCQKALARLRTERRVN
ncbi:MAG: site-specific DNA-methyltransferase [Terriglobia bacterium]|jgi:DNA modification methylase